MPKNNELPTLYTSREAAEILHVHMGTLAKIIMHCEIVKNIILLDGDGQNTSGIYNRLIHSLEPFSPDYVFRFKLATKYNPKAKNVKIKMSDGKWWDCESQLLSYGSDKGLQSLFNAWNRKVQTRKSSSMS